MKGSPPKAKLEVSGQSCTVSRLGRPTAIRKALMVLVRANPTFSLHRGRVSRMAEKTYFWAITTELLDRTY